MKQFTPIKVLIFSALFLASFSAFAMEMDNDECALTSNTIGNNNSTHGGNGNEKEHIKKQRKSSNTLVIHDRSSARILEKFHTGVLPPSLKEKAILNEIFESYMSSKEIMVIRELKKIGYDIFQILCDQEKKKREKKKILEEYMSPEDIMNIRELEKMGHDPFQTYYKKVKDKELKLDYLDYPEIKKLSRDKKSKRHHIKIIVYFNGLYWKCPNPCNNNKVKACKKKYSDSRFIRFKNLYLTEKDFLKNILSIE